MNNRVNVERQNQQGRTLPKETYAPMLYMVYAKITNEPQPRRASERAGTVPHARQPCSHDRSP